MNAGEAMELNLVRQVIANLKTHLNNISNKWGRPTKFKYSASSWSRATPPLLDSKTARNSFFRCSSVRGFILKSTSRQYLETRSKVLLICNHLHISVLSRLVLVGSIFMICHTLHFWSFAVAVEMLSLLVIWDHVNVPRFHFHQTRVRSLAMLVTNSLTHSLTNSLLFSKLDWCDPGMWRWQLKTCWSSLGNV